MKHILDFLVWPHQGQSNSVVRFVKSWPVYRFLFKRPMQPLKGKLDKDVFLEPSLALTKKTESKKGARRGRVYDIKK